MAVDALSVSRLLTEHIAVDEAFVIRFQTALVDGQVFVGDIRGCYETIADIRVDGIGRYVDVEGFVLRPLVVLLNIDLNIDGLPLGISISRCQSSASGLYLCSAADDLLIASCQSSHDTVAFPSDSKVSGAILTGTVTLV